MLWFTTICILAATYSQVEAYLDLDIIKYEACPEHKDTAIKHHATFKKVNSTVIVGNGDASVPFDLGEDVTFKITIDIKKDGEWKEFKSLEEKNPCKVFNKFGGDMWFELEEKVGVQKGACPLPKGDYKVTDHILDFTKLPVKTGPKAQFRALVHLLKESEVLLCLNVEVDSA